MSYTPSFMLRLRLEEAEVRLSHSQKDILALKWGVVQQPEFGPIHDILITSSTNQFAHERISRLLDAMRIPLDPSKGHGSDDLLGRLLTRRRYVLAVVRDQEWNGSHRWGIERYFRTAPKKVTRITKRPEQSPC